MNTQEKFTAAIRALAAERGLDLIVDRSWANTGRFRFQARGSFDSLLEFPFNFQRAYSSFTATPEYPLGNGPKGGSWSYVQGPEHDLLLERVAATLDSLGAPANPPEAEDFQTALAAFKLAAARLDAAWAPGREVDGYPAYLPDFSEFALDLQEIDRA